MLCCIAGKSAPTKILKAGDTNLSALQTDMETLDIEGISFLSSTTGNNSAAGESILLL